MKIVHLLFLLFTGLVSSAQIVNEGADFDYYSSSTDNDFENRFDNGTGLTQIQSNGITGGCLTTPQTISWGNDNAIYCTRYKGQIGTTYYTGICFKYDTLQLNNINFDRASSVWLKPSSDPNHYLVASFLGSRQIQLISYSATNVSNMIPLIHGHWYLLWLVAAFMGGVNNDQILTNAQIDHLGITGNDPPFTIGSTAFTLYDSVLIADSSIEVSITGTRWGGAIYLDNFGFVGMKSHDNCISTAVEEYSSEDIRSSMNGSTLTVSTGSMNQGTIEIHDVQGKLLAEKRITSQITTFETNGMSAGLYFLSVKNEKFILTRKFILK